MSGQEIQIPTDGGTLAGIEWGAQFEHRMLALHGWLDNAASFSGIGDRLDGIHLVAIDLPGHGKSMHRPTPGNYHIVDYVGDVLNAADGLGWEQFSLIGHSLGAGIASLFAGAMYDRLTSLILIDGIGPIADLPEKSPQRLRQALLRRREVKATRPRLFPDFQLAVEARKCVGNLRPESVEKLVERGLRECDGGFTWRHDRRLTDPSLLYMTESQVLAFVRSIKTRTLLIKAAGGIIDKFGSIERIVSVPDISLVELAGGHHLHLDDPEPVVDEIEKFFREDAAATEARHPGPDCLSSNSL